MCTIRKIMEVIQKFILMMQKISNFKIRFKKKINKATIQFWTKIKMNKIKIKE